MTTLGYWDLKLSIVSLSDRTFSSKPARYSKEEIERKKLEAQNRRRQKMAQSQKKNQN